MCKVEGVELYWILSIVKNILVLILNVVMLST